MLLPRYPEEDDELRALQSNRLPGGNACNSARVLAKLGHRVELMSNLAQDADSDWLLKQLQDEGIGTDLCPRLDGQSTPYSSIWLNQKNGSRTITHYRDLSELSQQQLSTLNAAHYDWIHFEGRNIDTLLQLLRHGSVFDNTPLSLEIEKARPDIEQLLPYMKVVIVSSHYLRQKKISAQQCIQQLKSINLQLNIVCTLGAQGLLAMDETGAKIEIQAEAVEQVVDSIGAGDCFIAGLISRLMQSENFKAALEYANHLAAVKVQHQGLDFDV